MKSVNKVTISDISRAAGVSIATVSRILNGKDSIKNETRQKVLKAMKELDFQPTSPIGFASSESKLILMSLPEFSNPFNSSIINGVQASALKQGYHLLLHQSKDIYTTIDDYNELLKNNPIAGLILLHYVAEVDLLEKLSSRCHVVMCSEYCEGSNISYVSIDDFSAAKNAVDYLFSIGRKKIALMNSSLQYKYARHREAGYIASLQNADIEVNGDWIVHLSDISFDMALSSATHLLGTETRPDAFFAVSDVFAVAIVKAAKRLGLRVPQDVAVIGFDNTDISMMTEPPLTTIKQPSYRMGYQACDLLIDKINSPYSSNKQILFDTELIVRGSTLF